MEKAQVKEKKEITGWIAEHAFKYRIPLLIFTFIVTVIMAFGLRNLQTKAKLEDMLPENHPYIKLHKKYSAIFGGANTVLCELKVKKGDIFNPKFLKILQELTWKFRYYKDVYPLLVDSITLQKAKYISVRGGGEVYIGSLVWPRIPHTKKALEQLKEHTLGSPLYNGVLVSSDGKAALIVAQFKPTIDYKQLYKFVQELRKKYNNDYTSIYLTGRPILLATIYSYWGKIFVLFAITFLIAGILLFLFLKCVIGFAVPLIVAILSATWGIGLAGYLRLNFDPLMIVLPFLVLVRCMSSAVQKVERFVEEELKTKRKDIAAKNTIKSMLPPCIGAVLTDAAGFGVMILSDIPFLKSISIILSLWIINLIFLSGIMASIFAYYLPAPSAYKDKKFFKPSTKDIWVRFNRKVAEFSITKGGKIVVLSFLFLIALLFGIEASKIRIGEISPGSSVLKADSVYNKDFQEITKRFDRIGPDTFILYFEGKPGAVEDPKFLHYIEAFEYYMKEHMPKLCGGWKSLTTIVRRLNFMFHEGDPSWNLIPDKKKSTEDLILLFRQKQPPGGFDCFADRLFRFGNTVLFFKNHTDKTIKKIKRYMNEFFKTHPPKIEGFGEFKPAGGVIGIHAAINESLQRDHLRIDLTVLIAIYMICTIVFRSFMIGSFLVTPLIVANIVGFGLMSLLGLSLTIETIPIAAVGVGIGVDFSVYLYSRYKEEYEIRKDTMKNLVRGAESVGRAILFIALVMIIPLSIWGFLAEIRFQAQMGMFYAIIFFVNLVFSLTFQPAIVSIFAKRVEKILSR